MIILASTSDLIRVVTADAADIDVHASWVDGISTITPGRTDTLITTATTTTVVGSPDSSTYRTVKTLVIRNRSTSGACGVTIVHTDGSTAVELIKVVLPAGGSVHYDEGDGFSLRRQFGVLERVPEAGTSNPSAGTLYSYVLDADVTANNVTASRMKDVRQLGFPVVEGNRYWFRFHLMYTAALATTGGRFNIYGPGSVTALRIRNTIALGANTQQFFDGIISYDASGAAITSASTGSNLCTMEGFIDTPTCDGLVFLRLGSEISASAIVLKMGSHVQWQRVT